MKFKVIIASTLFLLTLWFSSCRKDFEYAASNGHLSFSRDTVYLDTVFSTISSSTYTLKVYNETKDDVSIPSIKLRNGTESYYRLNVDGVAGNQFADIPLYAQDSIFIFIETTVDISSNLENTLLYTDAIQFDTDVYLQEVELVTLVKDAIFLCPPSNSDGNKQRIKLYTMEDGTDVSVAGFELTDDQLHLTNEKPYVVYGYASVPENQQLVIDAGARVHFHNGSGLLVQKGASLKIDGAYSNNQELLEGEVIFEGDRLEPSFADLPGQWGGVWVSNGSTDNTINHLTIKNADIGIYAEGNKDAPETILTISNSQIHNSTFYNLWAKSATITAQNVVLGNSGSSSLYCNLGGRYDFIHTTIANYWSNGFRSGRALKIDNHASNDSAIGSDLIMADFKNCIIDGNSASELSLSSNSENSFNYSFKNCLIKFKPSENQSLENNLYDFESGAYEGIILNGFPDYFNPSNNNFRIGMDSDVIDKGNTIFAQQVPFDLLQTERSMAPDLGAYQATLKVE